MSGPYDEAKVRDIANQQAQVLTELSVQKARIESELFQLLTPDQKTKLNQLFDKHEERMSRHFAPQLKQGDSATSVAVTQDFVSLVAAEIASGVDRAVECWMAQIEEALNDAHLTTLGRWHAVQSVRTRYKELTGKAELRPCRELEPA